MYRLVIVDDEPLIREGLVRHINWNKLGYEVVADFDDGSEALVYIDTHPVDVVLTDIIMCDVDGMELCRRLQQTHPSVRTVLLSGHRQFDYAKQAMQYNVFDYLLKPIKHDEIEQTFAKLKSAMDSAHGTHVSDDEQSIMQHRVQGLLRSILFTRLYEERMQDVNQLARYLYVADMPKHLITDNVYFYDITPAEKSALRTSHVERLHRYLHTECLADRYAYSHVMHLDATGGLLVVFAGSEHGATFVTEQVITKIRNEIDVNIALSKAKVVTPIGRMLPVSMYHDFTQCQETQVKDYLQLLSKYHLFALCFSLHDRDGLQKLITGFQAEIEAKDVDDTRFLKDALVRLIALSPNLPVLHSRKLQHDLSEADNTEHFEELLLKAFDASVATETADEDPIIDKVKRYVEEHISEDISISAVSQQVYFNSAYFGRYFKARTGEAFNEYLVRVRMQKAIEIMQEKHCRIEDISAQVGYDTKYFFSVFKKYTGYRPMEYYRKYIE